MLCWGLRLLKICGLLAGDTEKLAERRGFLFYLCFFIENMFTNPRIVFFYLHFLGVKAPIFGGGVIVSGTSC